MLSEKDKNLLDFGHETGLTPAQLRGEDHIPTHEGAGKCPYQPGRPLVWPELVKRLPTRMFALHEWYLKTTANGIIYLEVRIDDHHYLHG